MDLRGNPTEALEREVESALAEASVYDVSSYGWLNENDDRLARCELEELDALDGIEPQHAGQIVQGAGRHMDSDVSARARCTQVTLIPAKCALLRAPNRAFDAAGPRAGRHRRERCAPVACAENHSIPAVGSRLGSSC